MKIIKTKKYAQISNPLNGKTNQQAKALANKMIPNINGFFSDNNWEKVNEIWNTFNNNGLNWTMTDNQYIKDERGIPTGKKWSFEVYFQNKLGKDTVLYGTVVASGAGTVSDPLSRYDLTAYIS